VSRYVEEITPSAQRIAISSPEGRLAFARGALALDPTMHGTFRLPGPGLADVEHPRQRELLAEALGRESVRPEEFRIEGVPGFQLKGEDRDLLLRPAGLRMTTSPRGIRFTFELSRGAYALLVVQRLLADVPPDRPDRSRPEPRRENRPRPAARPPRGRSRP
jgi:tRNA(Glu) U13 pseudouridine synthase TruD